MEIRIGHGFDVHALAEGLRLVLCGVEIEHTKGCVAHSDGDVAIHAICDALLGALALGDIGKLFPDTDAKYKDIDSRQLLKEVVNIVADKGYTISNIDCTIAMQRPKLRPHIDLMRERLAEVVGIPANRISVKATTTERLGFE
ncbi:MAG: 2-C-methyl-D-erythritol 2,4-cyclodiphosphate synthase, partial [Alistipes sp.]|nr:2-C-methyl-D-erythritol 2,4-cyclodiphosphate synthase [Alistipes sp.]